MSRASIDLGWHPAGWTAVALPRALYAEWRRLTGLRDRLRGLPGAPRDMTAAERDALLALSAAIEELDAAVNAAHRASVLLLPLRA